MNKQMARRIPKFEISFMNIFCAMLVIFIHCASVPIGETGVGEAIFDRVFIPWRFSSFVVPAFIFMSGVKLFLTDRRINYPKFYRGRIKRVVIPYMLWVVIFMMFFVDHHYFEFSWDRLVHSWLRGDLVGHFYFVIIIVQFYLLMPLWNFGLRRVNPAVGVAFSILVSIVFGFNLHNMLNVIAPAYEFEYGDVIFTKYLFYWVFGCYVGMNYKTFKEMVLNKKAAVTVLFLMSAVLDIFLAYETFNTTAGWMEEVHILYCTSAIIFFFMVFSLICEKKKKMSWFTKCLDSESYNIYLSHCLVILWLNDYLITERGISDLPTRFLYVSLAAYIVPILFWMLWWLIKQGFGFVSKKIRKKG